MHAVRSLEKSATTLVSAEMRCCPLGEGVVKAQLTDEEHQRLEDRTGKSHGFSAPLTPDTERIEISPGICQSKELGYKKEGDSIIVY